MYFATAKAILALLVTTVLFSGAAVLYRRRRNTAAGLLALGIAFLIVVALTHLCEAVGLLPALEWGQPHSVGHYIDLGAALLAAIFVLTALIGEYVKHHNP
jgi:hypothetical protein